MKLTVIGNWGGYPKANEASSGYLLEQDQYHLLMDCGSGVLAKLPNFLAPEMLNGVFLTHYHADHIADIGVLQHARLIIGLLGKEMDCLPIYGHSFESSEFAKLTYKEITKGIAYQENETLAAGPFQVRFLKTKHPVDCFAIRLETEGKTLVYTGDTAYKEELVSFSQDADLLLCECNFYGHQDGSNAGHMTSVHAGKLAQKANVKGLVLTHLPHYGNIEQLKEEAGEFYNGEISLAHYGLTIQI
jgi:ribonuclease BN (tRNA processing enzyme)